jgi:hypothetical protein
MPIRLENTASITETEPRYPVNKPTMSTGAGGKPLAQLYKYAERHTRIAHAQLKI